MSRNYVKRERWFSSARMPAAKKLWTSGQKPLPTLARVPSNKSAMLERLSPRMLMLRKLPFKQRRDALQRTSCELYCARQVSNEDDLQARGAGRDHRHCGVDVCWPTFICPGARIESDASCWEADDWRRAGQRIARSCWRR